MMNLRALDLNLLVALESLLEEASVGRAADRVALSQPAMSHALKRLRLLLGDPLLVRVGPRMQLTTRGEALRDPVKDVLSRVRDLLVMGAFTSSRIAGEQGQRKRHECSHQPIKPKPARHFGWCFRGSGPKLRHNLGTKLG